MARQIVPTSVLSDVGGFLKRQRIEFVWSVYQGTKKMLILPEWISIVAPSSHDPCCLGSHREIKDRFLKDILIAHPLSTIVQASLNNRKVKIPHALSFKSNFVCVVFKLSFGFGSFSIKILLSKNGFP